MSGRPAHEILWDAVGDEPLPSLLLTHAAFEAFINHLGFRVAPEVWAEERTRFTTTPYRGVLGKVNWLCESLGVAQDWGAEPWQALKVLDHWRNRLAHGKLDDIDGWPETITADRVNDLRKAVRIVVERLCISAGHDDAAAPFTD